MKRTPLYEWHVAHGGKMVEFAGYQMPVRYQGIPAEHQAVRHNCGLFDVSHMGEIFFRGPHALATVQSLTSNDAARLRDGGAQYSLLMNEHGFAIDDILVYRLSSDHFFFCVNAANRHRDYDWITAHAADDVAALDRSDEFAMLALQGPRSPRVLEKMGWNLLEIPRFTLRETSWKGHPLWISRTGYTGEEGCEFFLPVEAAVEFWESVLSTGREESCIPVGLGARDTLRLEMGYVLYGHELSTTLSPWEAGLDWVISLKKGNFLGRESLEHQKTLGIQRHVSGFVLEESGIPREGMDVWCASKKIGRVLSGTLSPSLEQGLGTALIEGERLPPDANISIDIRGKMKKAKIASLPFFRKF